MDFSLRTYHRFLVALKNANYRFLTFEAYCAEKDHPSPFVILRHDVDLKAENSLATAKIEASLGLSATYYFRVISESNKPEIIKAIAALGHEIGYHYEDMTICRGNKEDAIAHFQQQLSYFRQFYPVKTICMHGAPRSKYDGKDLWKYFNYKDFEIIGEPYFDTDFSEIFYLTDTGRCWDGYKVSVRDKIPVYQDIWTKKNLIFHTTQNIIDAVQDEQSLLHQYVGIMITTHPQRWTDKKQLWIKEYLFQSLKNQVKRFLVKRN